MSQQENDNEKKDLPKNDPINPQSTNAGKNEEGTNEKESGENAFSESAQNPSKPLNDQDNDHLENAMLEETDSSVLRAERQEKEQELSREALEKENERNKEILEKKLEKASETEISPSDSSLNKTSGAKPDKVENELAGEDISEALISENKTITDRSSEKSEDESAVFEEGVSIEHAAGVATGNSEEKAEAVDNDSEEKAAAHVGKETVKVTTDNEIDETHEELDITTAAKKNAHSEFEDSVAEDSEDETVTERHGIDKKDYHSMTKEQLVEELELLVKREKIQAIKEHVEELKTELNSKFDEEVEEKKEEFLAEGGNIIDFHYSTPLKKQFNSVYFDYKEKRNNYYQQLKQDLNKNLNKRLEIIEELKGLLDVEENINTTYKHFRDLQDRWKIAGPIPRDKYNTVWNTYHHHVENFYDFLHLNRDFRDMDFKYNLEQKLKVIDRAEELTQEEDTARAFRELQMLHKMWKEELGPVAKEFREDIWTRFSEATKKIHDLRQAYYDQLDQQFEKNLEVKEEIITKIVLLSGTQYTSHNQWQQKIKEIEELRDQFFKAGKVPKEKNEETWSAFKQSVRQFNRNKNVYYKGLKKEQYDNLEKKRELIKIADEHKDSDDFKTTTPLMKRIQMDWKKIGHVPRKDSDKVWKQFKAACNHYFDRMHKAGNAENEDENAAFEKKKDILDNLKAAEFTGDKKQDLPKIKAAIEAWKHIGKVPYNKRFIEGKFNKLLDQLFSRLDVDNNKAEMMKYENKIHALNEADDDKKLRNEHYFLTKKIEETKAEIRQLENNLQFFANVDDTNPVVLEVHKNIQDHKDQLKVWQEKLEKIKSIY
ncbi:DUF349 domain-containing protein [soil metagenome]